MRERALRGDGAQRLLQRLLHGGRGREYRDLEPPGDEQRAGLAVARGRVQRSAGEHVLGGRPGREYRAAARPARSPLFRGRARRVRDVAHHPCQRPVALGGRPPAAMADQPDRAAERRADADGARVPAAADTTPPKFSKPSIRRSSRWRFRPAITSNMAARGPTPARPCRRCRRRWPSAWWRSSWCCWFSSAPCPIR